MLNLLKSELRLIAKKRSISGYKSMSKSELINAINTSEPAKNNRENIFKSKRKEIKKSLMKPPRKKILKSKIKEIKDILYDQILDRNEKIEEIKNNFYDPKNNLFKPKEDNYKPVRIGNAFSSNYIESKSSGDKDKTLSIKDYLDDIKPYLSDIINDHKTKGEWKIHVTMAINLFSSKDSEEIRTTHSKSDNIEILIGNETDEIIEDLFYSFLQKYQKGLEEPMKGSEFVFHTVDSLYYKLHKISLNTGGSYIYSPKWLKNKKATINPKNNDDKCFQYALTVALNHEQIGKDPQRMTKIKPFIDQYNWKGIYFPSHKKDWMSFKKIIR